MLRPALAVLLLAALLAHAAPNPIAVDPSLVISCFKKGSTSIAPACPLGSTQSWTNLPPADSFVQNSPLTLSFSIHRLGSRFQGSVGDAFVLVCREGALVCSPLSLTSDFVIRYSLLAGSSLALNASNPTVTVSSSLIIPFAERVTLMAVARLDTGYEDTFYSTVSIIRDILPAGMRATTRTAAQCYLPLSDTTIYASQASPSSPVEFDFAFTNSKFINRIPPLQWYINEYGDMRTIASGSLGGQFVGSGGGLTNAASRGFADGVINGTGVLDTPMGPLTDSVLSLNGASSIIGLALTVYLPDGVTAYDSCIWQITQETAVASVLDPGVDCGVCVMNSSRGVLLFQNEPETGMILRYSLGGAAPNVPTVLLVNLGNGTELIIPTNVPSVIGSTTGAYVFPINQLPVGYVISVAYQNQSVIDWCVLGRGPRSIAFPREFSTSASAIIDGSLVDSLVVGSTCEFTPFSNAPGNYVAGFVRMTLLPDITVRLSFSITGLSSGAHALSFAELGDVADLNCGGQLVPTYPDLSQCLGSDCSYSPTPLLVIPSVVASWGATASGVLNEVRVYMNGRNNVVGRAIRVHATNSGASPVMAACIVGITAELASQKMPERPTDDKTWRHACRLTPVSLGGVGSGEVRLEELYSANLGVVITRVFYTVGNLDPTASYGWMVTRLGDLQVVGQDLFNADLSHWPVFSAVAYDGLAVGTFDLPGTYDLLGRSVLVVNLANNSTASRCVVGMAQAVPLATAVTFAPTTPGPTLPFGQTAFPTMPTPAPPPPSAYELPQGNTTATTFFITVFVVGAFVVCCCLFNRVRRRSRQIDYTGDSYQGVEMNDMDMPAPPPLPPKPRPNRRRDGDDDDDVEASEMSAASTRMRKKASFEEVAVL